MLTLHSALRATAFTLLSAASVASWAASHGQHAPRHGGGDAPCGMAAGESHGMVGMQHGMGAMRWHHALHRLDLSDAQHDQVFELMHGQAKERHVLMRQLRQVQADLRATAQAPQFDNAKAQALAHEQAKLTAQQLLLDAQLEGKLRALLTPEQKQQLDQPAAHRPGMGAAGPRGGERPHAPMHPMMHKAPVQQPPQ